MTLAAMEKDEHSRRHPDYVYRPNKQRNGRQAPAPKRAYRPATSAARCQAPQPAMTTPAEMPAIGSLSISGTPSSFVPVASPSYCPMESAYSPSPSSSRSTPFTFEAQSPATESDYPQTPQSEYTAQLYDPSLKDVVNSYPYSYQSPAPQLVCSSPLQ